jgi:hypothetical protein
MLEGDLQDWLFMVEGDLKALAEKYMSHVLKRSDRLPRARDLHVVVSMF